MRKRLTLVGRIAAAVGLIYLTTCGVVYIFQDQFVFQGKPLPQDFRFDFGQPFEEHFIKVSHHDSLHAIFFKTDADARGLILYFHGNSDNLHRWGTYAVDFTSLGYDVLMIDYRGYGKSSGQPGETIFYEDAQRVYDWARDHIPHFKLVIYGRSLGAAVASNLAANNRAALLFLETPFDELRAALYGMPARYTFSNQETIPDVTCRIVIVHGTNDWVVPLRSALRLKPLLKPGDSFVVIDGGGHNDLRHYELYQETLRAALR